MTPPEERYQESFVVNDFVVNDRADWMLIKDRATGKVILVSADDRVDCLLVLKALNAYEAVK